ncbi:MAG TPA: hypothetical protein VLL08_13605 [Kineosporiaceae bacterium]|nr:hypothetical protein [Kineosporiaceae bacterium]
MNDDELDSLVRQAQPHADAVVAALDLGRGGQELLEEIMSTPNTSQLGPAGSGPVPPSEPQLDVGLVERASAPLRRRRRTLIGVAAVAAFAAAVAGPTIAFRGGNKVTVTPGHSAPAAAGDSPRLLLDDPAWKITHVDQDSPAEGEIRFTNGKRALDVNWRSAADYQEFYDDRLDVSKPVPVTLLGRNGVQFTYSPNDFAVILPPQGKNFLEIRGGGNKAAFAAVTAKLKAVSLQEWYAGMPASVVTPDRSAAVAKEMLADVPLPAGFDPSTLSIDYAQDSYQYGAYAVGTVTCAWLKDYASARAAHDEAGMATVDKALKTSRNWKTLKTMAKQGGYSEVIWEYADKVAQRKSVGNYEEGLCG